MYSTNEANEIKEYFKNIYILCSDIISYCIDNNIKLIDKRKLIELSTSSKMLYEKLFEENNCENLYDDASKERCKSEIYNNGCTICMLDTLIYRNEIIVVKNKEKKNNERS